MIKRLISILLVIILIIPTSVTAFADIGITEIAEEANLTPESINDGDFILLCGKELPDRFYIFFRITFEFECKCDHINLTTIPCALIVFGSYRIGNEVDACPYDTNPWRFTGEYFDRETGMIYLRMRFYNPRNGRFLNPDPLFWGNNSPDLNIYTVRQTANLYAYVMNNPIRFVDPSGESAVPIGKVAFISKAATVSLLAYAATPQGQQAFTHMATSLGQTINDMGAFLASQHDTRTTTINFVNNIINSNNWIRNSDAFDNSVYVLVNRDRDNEVRYVGRTINPNIRESHHRRSPTKGHLNMVIVMTGLDRDSARVWEQILISAYTLEALDNARNEIAARNIASFNHEIVRAMAIMTSNSNRLILVEALANSRL